MIRTIREIITTAQDSGRLTVAVAAAHDRDVIRAVVDARSQGIANAALVGDVGKIESLLLDLGQKPADYRIESAGDDAEAAHIAAGLVRSGEADFLMKGQLPTSTMMKAVIDREQGLRTDNLISHVMLYEVPGYPKLLALTDGGMNTYPDLEKKTKILRNAADALIALGHTKMVAACVCGAESVDPKIQSTVDADALSHMTLAWGNRDLTVVGPVGLDLAISREACEHKGYTAPGGEADILLVPNYEVGNAIGKTLTYFAHAKSAGVILGARVPIVLVSRADDVTTKLASIALSSVLAKDRREDETI